MAGVIPIDIVGQHLLCSQILLSAAAITHRDTPCSKREDAIASSCVKFYNPNHSFKRVVCKLAEEPFNFALDTVLEEDTEEKIALTQEQEDSLLSFAAGNPVYWKYRDEIIIFLGTGLRVSEFCGLTVNLDFVNRQINVDYQLLRGSETGYAYATYASANAEMDKLAA